MWDCEAAERGGAGDGAGGELQRGTTAWRAKWSDGEALLIRTMEGDKLWVQIVSIDTPSSSHRSALPQTQICLLAHHERSAFLSQGQPRQLRGRSWAEPGPPQPPTIPPCARRRRTQHRKAPWRADGQGANRAETGKNLDWWRSRAPFASCTLKKDATRTLPHARCVTPMRFHRVPRASAPSHHASWWRAPPSSAASRRCCVRAGVNGGSLGGSERVDH